MKFTKREMPKSEGNGISNFLKVGDGESVTGVFRGEVFEFFQSWPKGGQKQVFREPTPGASVRFKANFVVHEDGKFVAKVWEFGLTVYNHLAEISDEYDLEKIKVKITRRGLEKNTTWMILPLLNQAIPAKAMKELEAVPLNILGQAPAAAQSDASEGDSDVPF